MQRPPAVECGAIEINHGLAEGGWLRKIRFSDAGRALESTVPFFEHLADDQTGSKELSVEQWVKDLLALGATAAKHPTFRVPSVVCQAYTLGNDRLGILLVNLQRDSEESVRLTVAPVSYGLEDGVYELRQTTTGGQSGLGTFRDRHNIKSTLPPRDVVLLEATRLGG
jgi:hypothetical protein